MPFVMGALGTKRFGEKEVMKIKGTVETIRTTALLNAVRMLCGIIK